MVSQKTIDDADNVTLTTLSTMEEVKEVVFSVDSQSAPGPDEVTGRFYQSCWEIIKEDLLIMILDIFASSEIPKALTHTCLILLPKVECPQAFT